MGPNRMPSSDIEIVNACIVNSGKDENLLPVSVNDSPRIDEH